MLTQKYKEVESVKEVLARQAIYLDIHILFTDAKVVGATSSEGDLDCKLSSVVFIVFRTYWARTLTVCNAACLCFFMMYCYIWNVRLKYSHIH